MKTLLSIILLPITLWAACTSNNQQTINFIPGIYVNHAQSAYSIADDTLVITLAGNSYQVVRKTGFTRILNGHLQSPEHKAKRFTGVWDAVKQTLQLTQNGVMLQFLPDRNQLEIGNSTYDKIREGL